MYRKFFVLVAILKLKMKTSKSRKLTRIELEGYEVIEKKVNRSGTSGRIYLPVKWINKTVKVILVEK